MTSGHLIKVLSASVDHRWDGRNRLPTGDEGTMSITTLLATGALNAERVDWTYVNSRLVDATSPSDPGHHLAVQRDAAESAARLMSLVQPAHQREHRGKR